MVYLSSVLKTGSGLVPTLTSTCDMKHRFLKVLTGLQDPKSSDRVLQEVCLSVRALALWVRDFKSLNYKIKIRPLRAGTFCLLQALQSAPSLHLVRISYFSQHLYGVSAHLIYLLSVESDS